MATNSRVRGTAGLAGFATLLALPGPAAQAMQPADPDPMPDEFKTPPPASTAGRAPGWPGRQPGDPAFAEHQVSGFAAHVDQDLFYPARNEDRNYTMGVALQISGAWIPRFRLSKPLDWLDYLFGISARRRAVFLEFLEGQYSSPPPESHSLTFASTGFTPDNLNTTAAIQDDRPYSSVALLAVGHSLIDPRDGRRWALQTELAIGILGLRVAETVQTWIHQQIRPAGGLTPYDPLGWPNQISDGGEPTAKYTVRLSRALSESRFHDLAVQTEGSLGFYTNAAVGGVLRVGRIRSDFWSFSSNPIGVANQALDPARPLRSRTQLEVYGWVGGRARVIVYNALLQGQFRRSPVVLRSDEIEHVVGEFEMGLSAGICGWTASWSVLAGRTPEYDVGRPRLHAWGGLSLTYNRAIEARNRCF